ncbi:MAG: hypothetical protein HQL22_06540 [Candidatus Omnitrophica bacterium]|nr:hypothetical protein [Candidatus Omnitrophota bacterium]
MGFCRKSMLGFSFLLVCGCVSTRGVQPSVAFDEGYQHGIKENLGKMAEGMNGNGFPYLGGSNWASPLVQEVHLPAHVQGGVFYPEHNELVIITPGEWKKAGVFPLRSNVVKDPGPVEVLAADITALPQVVEFKGEIK